MAKKIEQVNVRLRAKYNWNEWADGDWWLLIRGEDYYTDVAVRCAAYAHAQSRGMTVETHLSPNGEGMYVRFTKIETPPVKKVLKKLPRRGKKS